MLKKINNHWFDIFVVSIILLVGLVYVLSKNNRPDLGSQRVLVEIVVVDANDIKNLLPYMNRLPKEVFYNGTKYPVQQIGYKTENDTLGKELVVSVLGPGDLSQQGKEVFNGQRILINQKAEIRGDYFAQGRVRSYKEYEP